MSAAAKRRPDQAVGVDWWMRRSHRRRAEAQRAATEGEPEWFVDRAQATGLDFVHFNGMSGSFYQPEIMAPGVGLFDDDNDGDLDVDLVQEQMLGTGKTFSQAVFGRGANRSIASSRVAATRAVVQ